MAQLKWVIFHLCFFLFSIPALTQTTTADGIVFDAEDATIEGYDKKNQIVRLSKAVRIIYQGQFIECDKATINTIKQIVNCAGNVRMIGPQARLQADEVTLNYKDNTGEIKNGFVQVGQVTFEGELIRKLSEDKYQTLKGYYTACTSCPAFWSFRGSRVDAELGGYAHIRNATLYFGKVPALWFPYLVVPIKSERQSGFLFPNYEISGSKGFTIEESFFWALNDHMDATLTTKYYTQKGLKGMVNYRYVLAEDSRGEFDFGYLQDKTFSRSDELKPFNPNQEIIDRWFVKYKHMYVMPYDFVQRAKINAVGDSRYPKDFRDEMPGRGDTALENSASITKNSDKFHASFDTTYYRNLLASDPLNSDSESVHRFPEININLMPQNISNTNFLLDMSVNYTNFSRDNVSYDDRDANGDPIAKDGRFDPSTDLIRTGQRLDIEPTISYPINVGTGISVVPSVSYRETRYQFPIRSDDPNIPIDPTTYRRYIRTNLATRTQFSRIFGDLTNPIASRYKHIIQPEISYSYIPYSSQPGHIFFANDVFDSNFKRDQPVSNGDNIQFDYKDRVYEKNLVTYSLVNKFFRKKFTSGSPEYFQSITHKLSQSYDIHEDRRQSNTSKQPWTEISSLLDIRFDFFDAYSLIKYYPYQGSTAHNTRFKVRNKREDFFELTYSQDFLITNGIQVDLNSRTEDIIAGVGLNFNYLMVYSATTYDIVLKNIKSFKYTIKLKPPGNCWSLVFHQEKLVATESDVRFGISFLFDGKTETGLGGI